MIATFTMVSAIVPSLLLLWYFHSRDTFPEPAAVLWRTFALGALAIVPVCVVALPVMAVVDRSGAPPFLLGTLQGFLGAAIPEEGFKLAVLYWYVRRRSEFDEPMDGLVYGAAASLGFATLENVLYCAEGGPLLAVLRAVTAIPIHAGCGAIMGYYFGRSHFERFNRGSLLALAYVVPVFLHGIYDAPILTLKLLAGPGRNPPPTLTVVLFGLSLLLVLITVAWTVVVVRRARLEQRTGGAPAPAAPLAPQARRTASTGSVAGGAILVGLGALLATAGGLLTLSFVLVLLLGKATEGGPGTILAALLLFGALPAGLGLASFAGGVRLLNRPR